MKEKVEELLTLVKNYNATLIGVSKYIEIDKILESITCGINNLGESRVQELSDKIDIFRENMITTHFIGHLQSNKSKKCVELSDYIHTVDSLKKAETINRHSIELGKKQKIFLQVNISNDENKFGLAKESYLEIIDTIFQLPNIELVGLMTIGLLTENKAIIKDYYKDLRLLMEETQRSYNTPLYFKELSMGMSSDYKIALDQGSTFIRVGSSIYGERM